MLLTQQLSDYSVEYLTVKDGISQNSIKKIMQDSKGFIWIGTRAGLNRYNAYQFEEFKHLPFDTSSLADSQINDIYEDSDTNIWIATSSGLDRFNHEKRNFEHFEFNTMMRNSVQALIEDRNKNLWIGSALGIFIKDSLGMTKDSYLKNGDLDIFKTKSVTSFEIQSNYIWVGTTDGLYQFNLINSEVSSFKSEENNFYSLSSNFIIDLIIDKRNVVWAATDLGLNRYNQFEERFYGYFYNIQDSTSLSSDYITSLALDQLGNLWATSKNGVNIHSYKSDDFKRLSFATRRDNFNQADLSSIHIDQLGTIWIGSQENGLIQLIPRIESFKLYNSTQSPRLTSNIITAIYEDKLNNLWVGTDYGLNRLSKNRGVSQHYYAEPFNIKSLSNDYINDIIEDPNGRLWIATEDGLNWYDTKTEEFQKVYFDLFDNLKVYKINQFISDSLWIATNNGIGIYHILTNHLDIIDQLKEINARIIYYDSKNRLWIGEENGLYLFIRKNNSVQVFNHTKNRNSISNNHILSIHEDQDKQIWIGTRAGLNKYRDSTNDFKLIEEVIQLADDQIHWIESDKKNHLWISTNKGITRIDFSDEKNPQIKNFDSDDGLQNFAFRSAGFRSSGGELFFGGNNGLNSFFPEQIVDRTYEVPNVIESIVTNNRTIYLDITEQSNHQVFLDYDEQVITFNFTSLDFINSENNQYQYRLDGVDEQWIQSGKSHSVSYSNLIPNTYKFSFRGSNSSFNWNNSGASVTIIINPPYWDSWWFRSIIAISMFLVVFTFLYNRFKRLQEIREIRGRIARDLHDDIGASLTEVTLMSELAQQLKNKEQLNSVLFKIEDVTRGLVSSLGDLVWSIDTKNETLESLLLRMKDFASDLLLRKDIQINYEVIGIKQHQKINHHLKQTIYLIFKEAVNNVVKHSNAKNMFVQLKDTGKKFSLLIRDDGGGFDLSAEQSGNGLNNMQIRAKRIGGEVEFSIDNGLQILLKSSAISF